jgi:outer membrane protein insertion porin family
LGAYNQDRGCAFERFYVGGDGLANSRWMVEKQYNWEGILTIPNTPIAEGEQLGATVYNKFSMELRYPITLKSSASIYALGF